MLGDDLKRVVFFVVFAGCCFGCIYEFFRFNRVLDVVHSQRNQFLDVLTTTSCRDVTVHSVKYNGRVVDCYSVRLALDQPVKSQAFMLWWDTSAWTSLWTHVMYDKLMLTVLIVIIVIAFIYILSSTFLQSRMQDQFVNMVKTHTSPLSLEYRQYDDFPIRQRSVKKERKVF